MMIPPKKIYSCFGCPDLSVYPATVLLSGEANNVLLRFAINLVGFRHRIAYIKKHY